MIEKRQHAVNSGLPGRTAAGEALTSLILRVVRLSTAFTAKGEELAQPSGQTLARWVVLDAVMEAPATVSEVGRRLGYARQSIQRVADLLVEDDLAIYEDNPEHRRAKLLGPTKEGRRIVADINRRQKAWSDELGAAVGEEDLATMGAILDRILEEMSK